MGTFLAVIFKGLQSVDAPTLIFVLRAVCVPRSPRTSSFGASRWTFTDMESMMIRILLPACLFLAAILLFHTDLPTTAYQAHAATRVAQEDSDKAQAPDTSAPDTDSSDKSGSPPKDEE